MVSVIMYYQSFLIEVSVMQVHRVTDTYGNLLEQAAVRESPSVEVEEIKPNESVYAMTDGSMILTREEGWNETKLGRIFRESDCMEIGGERGRIRHSAYEAYLGDSRTFTFLGKLNRGPGLAEIGPNPKSESISGK